MVISGLAILSLLVGTGPLLEHEFSLIGIIVILLYLAAFCGLFCLGYRLLKRGKKTAFHSRKSATPVKTVPRKSTAPAKPLSRKSAAPVNPLLRKPAERSAPSPTGYPEAAGLYIYGMDRLCLYRDPEAAKASWRSVIPHQVITEEIYLDFKEGVPVLACRGLEHVEIGNGKEYLDDHSDIQEIPAEMHAGLTSEELKDWIRTRETGWPVDWDIIDWDGVKKDMRLWCSLVKKRAGVSLPDGVYEADCPFLSMFDEEVEVDSDISLWLRMKENADLPEVIHSLGTRGTGGSVVVMTEDAGLLRDLPFEDLELCNRADIRFGYFADGNGFTDLVTLRKYTVKILSWPGSADDAATCRQWYLAELPPSPEERVRVLTIQIVGDCRKLGVDEKKINSLLRAELQMVKPVRPGYTFSYDTSTKRYSICEWERGHIAGGIEDTDEMEFRFKFQQAFVYHCEMISPFMHDPEQAAALLRDTRELFGGTKAYHGTLLAYQQAFPEICMRQDLRLPLHLSHVRTVVDLSCPGDFGQQDTLKVEIMQDEDSSFFLQVRKHTVTAGSNGRPETMNSTVCYPLDDPESVKAENWKESVSYENQIVIGRESFCGI